MKAVLAAVINTTLCYELTRHTVSVGTFNKPNSAATPSGVFFRLAVRVWSAKQTAARTNAGSSLTSQRVGTVLISSALTLDGSFFQYATSFVSVTYQAPRADALVATLLVDALSSVSTR